MSVKRYVMTARRKAALRKAQIVSARKRRGKKSRTKIQKAVKNAALVGTGAAILGASAYGGYKGKKAYNRRKVDRSSSKRTQFGPVVAASVETMNMLHGQRTAALARQKALGGDGPNRRLAPYIPAAPVPPLIDRDVFNENAETTIQTRYGPWRTAWTASERRRRKRLQINTPWTRVDRQRPISLIESIRRTEGYKAAMQRRGVKVNLTHIDMVSQAYRRMTY